MDILYRDGERKNPVEMKEGAMFYNKAENKTFIRDKNGYLVEVGGVDVTGFVTKTNGVFTNMPKVGTKPLALDEDKVNKQGGVFTNMPKVGGAPIVASGTNANGTWIKYADGTMICTYRGVGEQAEVYAHHFPAEFKNGSVPTVIEQSQASRDISTAQPVIEVEYNQTTHYKFNVIRKVVNQTTGVYSKSTVQAQFSYIAIGVWK